MVRYSPRHRLIDFLLISVAFGIALLLYNTLLQGGLSSQEMLICTGTSVFGFWLAVQLKDWGGGGTQSEWIVAMEQFCFGTGVNLLFHALMTYGFLVRRTPFLVVTGSLLSAVLLAGARRWVLEKRQMESRVVLVGFDSVARKIVRAVRFPLLGIIGVPLTEPVGEIPFLGSMENLDSVVETVRPTHLIVSIKDWQLQMSPSDLLRYRLSGMVVEEVQTVYEKLFSRVCCERLQPMDLLLSSALRGDSRTMAIQAIYTNLGALFFLLLLSPLMLLIGIAVALFSGPGPGSREHRMCGLPVHTVSDAPFSHDAAGWQRGSNTGGADNQAAAGGQSASAH